MKENKGNIDWNNILLAGFYRGMATPMYQVSEVTRSQLNIYAANGLATPRFSEISKKIGLKNTLFCGVFEQTAKASGRELCYRGIIFNTNANYDLGFGNTGQTFLASAAVATGDTIFNGAFDHITESRSRAFNEGSKFNPLARNTLLDLVKGTRRTSGISFIHSFGYWVPCLLSGAYTRDNLQFTTGVPQKTFDVGFTALVTTIIANPLENTRKHMTGVGAVNYNGFIDAFKKLVASQGVKKLGCTGFGLYLAQNVFTSWFMLMVTREKSDNEIKR